MSDTLSPAGAATAETSTPDPAEALRTQAHAELEQVWPLISAACTSMARADLADRAATARALWEKSRTHAAEAEAACTAPRAEAETWAAKHADAQARLTNLRTASTDDDLVTQIEAESLIVATERVVERVAARRAEAEAALAPLEAEAAAARADAARHEDETATLAQAAVTGLSHPLARGTTGHEEWVRWTWPLVLAAGDPGHPDWVAAKRHLYRVLRLSGIGAQIEENTILGRDIETGAEYRPIVGRGGKREGWVRVPRAADMTALPEPGRAAQP